MPRGRKRKFKLHFNIRTDTIRTVIALLLVLSAILMFIAILAPNYPVNEKIYSWLRRILGSVAITLPFILGLTGFLFIDKMQPRFKEIRILLSLVVFTLSLAGVFHLFINEQDPYKIARNGGGGGIIGYHLSSFLKDSTGAVGAGAIFIFLILISVFVGLNISLDQIIKFVVEHKPNIDWSKFKLIRKRGDSNDKEDIEITSGFNDHNTGAPSESEVREKDIINDNNAPIFEIVPPFSEPQQSSAVKHTRTADPLYQEQHELPKLPSDKIWQYPSPDLLLDPPSEVKDTSDSERRSKTIVDTLHSFGIDVSIENIRVGSSVTQYSLKPKTVTKISKISSLQEDLALALASPTGSVRIEAPIPGQSLIGIEVPNASRSTVFFRSLLTSDAMKGIKSKLGIVLGKDVAGKTYVYDISNMPHMLIAGATGSGKSIFIHNIMLSILYRSTPSEVKFILVDPKRVELNRYEGIPHLYTNVVTDMDKAPSVFKWAVAEMEKRYRYFEQARVSNIDKYNEKSGIQAMPYIVIVVDELGEIMMKDPAGVEKSIIRIAQLARATGIHLILAVQRPSINVVTGLIKANIPCRVAFNVTSQIDSRVIIDQPGAEKLLGKGDMLFVPPEANKPIRLQGAFVRYEEVDAVTDFLKKQGIDPDYNQEILNMTSDKIGKRGSSNWGDDVDELFDEAVEIVQSMGKASASLLQRKMKIGFARAARIIDEMEGKGIIGPSVSGSKARDVTLDGLNSGISDTSLEDTDDEYLDDR
ncbi:MAG TPA: DNA translocase FtsK 4TM domain-containing protein [bacterium]|nr:DNA translocase FtsK 4TM domain-containing protein [bacterium]